MNRRTWYFRSGVAIAIILSPVVFSLVAYSTPVTVTPLLDTPNNRTYYDELIDSVKEARSSISVLMATADYYPEYPDGLQNQLYDALVNAKNRGLKVRIILDKSNWSENVTRTNQKTAMYLRNRGLTVRLDDPKVTTHAKIIIVDKEVVLLGSSNWNFPTYTETYQANLKLVSGKIGRFYGRFFDTLWRGETPGNINLPQDSEAGSIVPLVSTGKSRSYYDTAMKLIKGAEKSIDLVVFKITRYTNFGKSKSNLLTQALVDARNRGVEVRIVLDVNTWSKKINQSNRETALWFLGKGIRQVKFDSPQVTTHSKALMIDGESVLVGSTNWSYYSLSKNIEVDVAIKNIPSVVKSFETYFRRIWNRAKTPTRKELSGGTG
ncbi:MAG: phosphatidylserine/phosphatidylglycerophosphate/cardiolipin synthase family protein [Candidatus Bipolaricaulia bacterium]